MPTRARLTVARFVLAVLLAACTAASGARPPARPSATPQMPANQRAMRLETDTTEAGDVRYLLYLPPAYAKARKPWPLVLFLHGLGESGHDLALVGKHGPPKLIGAGNDFPFICVSPQCPKGKWWSRPDRLAGLVALLDHVQTTYRVDTDRVYLTGLSMGGFGTWALAAREPKRFAALAPICGKGDPATAERFAQTPTWVFHGDADRVVPLQHSRDMVDALRKAGGTPKLTVYEGVGHDSWTRTYANPDFWKWILAQRRKR